MSHRTLFELVMRAKKPTELCLLPFFKPQRLTKCYFCGRYMVISMLLCIYQVQLLLVLHIRYSESRRLHSGPENLKSPGQKNSWNQINQFHEKFFLTKLHFFFNIKNGQKWIFELGKSLILPKMQFHEKKYLFDFMSFFA